MAQDQFRKQYNVKLTACLQYIKGNESEKAGGSLSSIWHCCLVQSLAITNVLCSRPKNNFAQGHKQPLQLSQTACINHLHKNKIHLKVRAVTGGIQDLLGVNSRSALFVIILHILCWLCVWSYVDYLLFWPSSALLTTPKVVPSYTLLQFKFYSVKKKIQAVE